MKGKSIKVYSQVREYLDCANRNFYEKIYTIQINGIISISFVENIDYNLFNFQRTFSSEDVINENMAKIDVLLKSNYAILSQQDEYIKSREYIYLAEKCTFEESINFNDSLYLIEKQENLNRYIIELEEIVENYEYDRFNPIIDYETIKHYEFVKCIEQKLYTNPFLTTIY